MNTSLILLVCFVSISVAVLPGLESTFEDGLETYINTGLEDFKDIVSRLNQAIDQKTNPDSSSSSTESDSTKNIQLLIKELEPHLENFKAYFKSITGLNYGLMDKLKEFFTKITTVSSNKPIEPECFDYIKKTLINIISQAMECRFKVVYTIDWIRVRLDYFKSKGEWMTLREELIKLKQKYDAIEMNSNKYLTSFNEMLTNPADKDNRKINEVMDYFETTIEEGEFNSITEEIIEKIERLKTKYGPTTTILSIKIALFSIYLNECEQEMVDKMTTMRRRRMARDRTEYRDYGSIYDEDEVERMIRYITRRYAGSIDDEDEIERKIRDITRHAESIGDEIESVITYIRGRYGRSIADEHEIERMIRDRTRHAGSIEDQNDVYQLKQDMGTIRSILNSSNDYQKMVDKTIEAVQTLKNQRIIKDYDLSGPLETFIQKIQHKNYSYEPPVEDQ